MTDLLDLQVRRKARPMTPWFDADCRAARRRVRAAEGRFRRRRTDDNKLVWTAKLQTMHALYKSRNNKYWQEEIVASKGNMKKLWKALHGVMGEMRAEETMDHTADDFASFFNDKVESVQASTAAKPLFGVAQKTTPILSECSTVTVDEIDKLIGSAPNKTCQLDPVPTWLLK